MNLVSNKALNTQDNNRHRQLHKQFVWPSRKLSRKIIFHQTSSTFIVVLKLKRKASKHVDKNSMEQKAICVVHQFCF